MITEVGAEQNTTTSLMMPSEFVSMAGAIAKWAKQRTNKNEIDPGCLFLAPIANIQEPIPINSLCSTEVGQRISAYWVNVKSATTGHRHQGVFNSCSEA